MAEQTEMLKKTDDEKLRANREKAKQKYMSDSVVKATWPPSPTGRAKVSVLL